MSAIFSALVGMGLWFALVGLKGKINDADGLFLFMSSILLGIAAGMAYGGGA